MTDTPRLWMARAGGSGEDEEAALDGGMAIIGFREVPSLAGAGDYESVAKIVAGTYPEAKPRAHGNWAGQLWALAVGMQQDDLIVLPRKLTSQIAVGRVAGPYQYRKVGDEMRHTRPVHWIRTDIARPTFGQDLLNSFGAFLTVCNVSRNDAVKRVQAVLETGHDPGAGTMPADDELSSDQAGDVDVTLDLAQVAHDQIVARIQDRFKDHALARLVGAVLDADGWSTDISPPGPDGGVDILAARGPLGLDPPRLCVQVKSQGTAADVTIYRALQGSMQTFKAELGLLVCWGGFTTPLLREARHGHFTVRLWDSGDLVAAIYRTYERLPAEIQADLPLKKVWMLVPEGEEA